MTATTILRITARRPAGFRRAGVFHPATPVDRALDSFTDAQLEALQAEPQLHVELIELEAPNPNTSQPPVGEVPAGESAPAGPAQAEAPSAVVTAAVPPQAAAPVAAPTAAPAPKPAKAAPVAAPKKGKGK